MTDITTTPPRRPNVTIREVAEKAGVSQMTVSRVLNKTGLVKEETTRRVEEAIRALNYRPNLLARGLAGGKALFLGLIYNNPSTNYLGEVLIGALNECRADGHHLLVEDFLSDQETMPQADLARRILESGVDGIIVCPPLAESAHVIDALRESKIPFVHISPGDPDCPDPFVMIDDAAAGAMMAEHIATQGHTRIGCISGPVGHKSAQARLDGFRGALERYGIDCPPDLVVEGAFTYRSGMEAADSLLDLDEPPSAIFASNDDMAAGAVAAAHRRGLQVPQDLSIAGFDDTQMAGAVWPGLTTVRQPIADMARQAVQLLGQYVTTGAKPGNVVLDVSLVERASVARPTE